LRTTAGGPLCARIPIDFWITTGLIGACFLNPHPWRAQCAICPAGANDTPIRDRWFLSGIPSG